MKTMIRRITTKSGSYRNLYHWCEACGHIHGVRLDEGVVPPGVPKWTWNGDREKPTLSPSILNFTTYSDEEDNFGGPRKLPDGQRRTLCHYFLKSGVIEYCGDNPHALNGKSVPLIDIPDGYGFGGSDDG